MSFHITELQKIQKSTKGFFKGKMKSEISMKIRTFDGYVNEIKNASGADREELIGKYLEIAQGLRHSALALGATGANDPKWAAAATVESWICLLRDGSRNEIELGESIINSMR